MVKQRKQYHFIMMRALKVDLAGLIVRYQDMSDKELPDEEKSKQIAMPGFLQ
ncbi:hypothetical protein [Heyndrickxia oleronia]|uniref:hypothetical protein n=1 Tax=Heyndrickxia oleronia TaxID=38875 RepID=UPI001B08B0ED|nr:hypothetical protein [Heyndrickxia oleronia]GIN39259.1 hypothetical protein J19TS1_22080 [Heyndrickxia oleronia]